ncbi:MAG TPA: cytochrome P450 [Enhygromyxa sp.]|nr:cytochrome P450 [Enhygromyxa sp.]
MITAIPQITTREADVALPPGPRSRVLNTVRYVNDVVGALTRWRARYGDTFTLRDLSGTTVVTCDPALVKALYCSRDARSFGAVVPPSFEVLLGRRSLLMLRGARHQEQRRLLLGPLCRAALPEWIRAIAGATRAVFAGLQPGRQFVALERMRELTVASMSQILFGPDDPAEPALRRAAIEMMSRVRPSFLVTKAMQLEAGGASRFGRFMIASRAFDSLLGERIARGRASGERDGSMLALLLASFDEDQGGAQAIRDQVRTLLIGGHETITAMLAWALYYIHRDPELLARARAEVDGIDDDAGLSRAPLLDAIVDETLRIRPPPGQCFRTLVEPLELGPWFLPAGVIVSPAICLLHHREDLWREPARFDPDRFLGQPPPSPFVYMPFGGGNRRCVGASLAKVESAIVLGTILRELELELDEPSEPAWARDGLALCPRPGVRMRVRRRRG